MGEARRKKMVKTEGLAGRATNLMIFDEFHHTQHKKSWLSRLVNKIADFGMRFIK